MLNYLITLLFEDNEKLCTCKLQYGFKRHSLPSIHNVFTPAQCNTHVHRGISTVYILMYCVLRASTMCSQLHSATHMCTMVLVPNAMEFCCYNATPI